MAIDYWKLVKEFKAGDIVQRYAPGQGGYSLSPFLGRVTAVHRGLGVLDVQWPYGNERVFPDDIVPVQADVSSWFAPELVDQTYMGLDTQRARELWASASKRGLWKTTEVPPGFYVNLAQLWSKGASEVGAYDELWQKHGSVVPDDMIRGEVAKFFLVGRNLTNLRIEQHAAKTAAYWVAQNRQYRVTQREFESGRPQCPKCGASMRKTTYKMHEGARHRLFACPKDLFLIKVTDILGPQGEPVSW